MVRGLQKEVVSHTRVPCAERVSRDARSAKSSVTPTSVRVGLEDRNVGEVAVQIKVMPDSPEVDLKKLRDRIKSTVSDSGRMYACEVQPIAFGLKALLVTFIVEDKEGGSEALEEAISNVDDVESVQVVAVTRML